jgi:tetratricopeptide (TPR) repeat protein
VDQLAASELIFRRGIPPDAEYTFKHALVQDAAYSTLLRSRRQQIHARIATSLEEQFPEVITAQPALLAHHCTEAGLIEKAVGYWLKAGQLSISRSVMAEAVAQLEKGLEIMGGLAEGLRRDQLELALQMALGPALFATKSFAAPEVGQSIARGLALADSLCRPEYLAPLLYNQWVHNNARGELRLALSFAEQMRDIGQASDKTSTRLLADTMLGITHMNLGEPVPARGHLEQCDGLSNYRDVYASLTAEDPYTVTLGCLGLTLTCIGYLDQGRSRIEHAISEARRLHHACTLSLALCYACRAALITGAVEKTQLYADEIIAIGNEHGFPHRLAEGCLHRGNSLAVSRQTEEGLTLLEKGLSILRATRTLQSTAIGLMMVAKTSAHVGQYSDAMKCLEEAGQIANNTDGYIKAELYRLRGDLLDASGDRATSEQCYWEAVGVAKRQEAKTFELRATTSLARLWRNQGKRIEARELLSPVYNWFTEGFESPVLKDAKTLLESLH